MLNHQQPNECQFRSFSGFTKAQASESVKQKKNWCNGFKKLSEGSQTSSPPPTRLP